METGIHLQRNNTGSHYLWYDTPDTDSQTGKRRRRRQSYGLHTRYPGHANTIVEIIDEVVCTLLGRGHKTKWLVVSDKPQFLIKTGTGKEYSFRFLGLEDADTEEVTYLLYRVFEDFLPDSLYPIDIKIPG